MQFGLRSFNVGLMAMLLLMLWRADAASADIGERLYTSTSQVYRDLSAKDLDALDLDQLLELGFSTQLFGSTAETDVVLAAIDTRYPELDPERRAFRLFVEGAKLQWTVNYSDALLRLDEAARLATEVGAVRIAAEALKAMAYTHAVAEDFSDATMVVRRLQELDASTDDQLVSAMVEESLGEVNGYSARFPSSIQHYNNALQQYQALGYKTRLHEVMLGLATSYRYMGNKEAAVRAIDAYLELLDLDNSVMSRFFGNYTRAMTLTESGDCAAGIPAIRVAREIGGPPDFEGELAKQLAYCELQNGNIDAAEAAVREANQLLFSKPDLDDTASAAENWRITAAVMFRKGESDEAYMALMHYVDAMEASIKAHREQVMIELLEQADADQHNVQISRLQHQTAEQELLVSRQQASRQRLIYSVVLMTLVSLTLAAFYVLQRRRAATLEHLGNELERARDSAESASGVKSEFLANMSHEMRTPMSAIIGLCKLAMSAEMNPRQRDYLKKIHVSATSLLNIINEVLDLGKIESGHLHIESISFSIDELLDDLASVMGTGFEEKGLEFLFDRDPRLPPILIGDPYRLNQILLNLTGNARKFTDHGSVVVRVAIASDHDQTMVLRFAVEDSGIGIDNDRIEKLFEPFVQGDKSTTRKYGGTGLGLTICRRLADLMGGRIWAESTQGQGSTFFVELPFQVPASAEAETWTTDISGVRILVVDDNPIAQQIFSEELRYFGFEPAIAATAEQAYAVLCETDETAPFDVVLMDYRLPDTDGLSAAAEIRQSLSLQHMPHIVLVTAVSGMVLSESDRRRELVDEILSKPVNLRQLFNCIVDLVKYGKTMRHDEIEDENSLDSMNLEPIRGARVLLVEDNHINQQVAVEYLMNGGLIVDAAENGEQALSMMEKQSYDCVLMDVQMPIMDGYTATRRIRQNPLWSDLPVLAMTANVLPEDRARALEAGMNAHIGKPFSARMLFTTLLEWITPVQGRDHAAAASPAQAAAALLESAADLPRRIATTPIEHALANVNNNRALLHRLLVEFEQDHRDDVQRLHQMIASGQHDEAQRLAHTLKGVCGTLGLDAERAAAYDLERRLEGADITGAQQACERFGAMLGAVMADLAGWRARIQPASSAAGSDGEASTESVGALLSQLRRSLDDMDLGAVDIARHLQLAAGGRFEATVVELVEAAEALEFDRAVEILDEIEVVLNKNA